jgi:5-methylcytosine-specific restriction endonuclease McrA
MKGGEKMAISETTRRELYQRAGGRCECTMSVCSHHPAGVRCGRELVAGYWEAHHRSREGGDTLSNLIAMCATCHKNTRSYGRP